MRLNNTAIYRHNIGTHYNKTHSYYDNGKLKDDLAVMAEFPGDVVARCRANLFLHLLIIVSNTAEACVSQRHVSRQSRWRASDKRILSNSLQNINRTTKTQVKSLKEAHGMRDISSVMPRCSRKKNSDNFTRHPCNNHKNSLLRNCRTDFGHPATRYYHQAKRKTDFIEPINIVTAERWHTVILNIAYDTLDFIGKKTVFPMATASIPPAGIIDNQTFTIDDRTMLYYPKVNADAVINKQNSAMSLFLQDYLRLPYLTPHTKAELISAMFVYLESNHHNPDAMAKVLLGAAVYYGGGDDEVVSLPISFMVIRRWLQFNILENNFEDFIANEIINGWDPANKTLSSLGEWLRGWLDKFANEHLKHAKQSEKNLLSERLWQTMIIPEFPVLAYWLKMPFNSTRLNDFSLGEIHAGLLFAGQNSVASRNVTLEEAADLGKFIQLQIETGFVPSELLELYHLPALLRFNGSHRDPVSPAHNLHSLLPLALRNYFNEKERELQEKNPFYALYNAMENYKTRPQLAEKIINETCPYLYVSRYLLEITPTCLQLQPTGTPKYNQTSQFDGLLLNFGIPKSFMLVGLPMPFPKIKLPDIDKIFTGQNKAIGEKYAAVERILLVAAWSDAFDLNDQYWTTVEINKVTAQLPMFQPRHGFKYCPKSGFLESTVLYEFPKEAMKLIMAVDVELFTLSRSQKIYLYALQREANRYAVVFVCILQKSSIFSMADAKASLCFNFIKTLKYESQNFHLFMDALISDRTRDFEYRLYAEGYEKHFLHITRDFVLSLIPFFSCLDGISQDPLRETLFDCGMDILSLIPVFGQMSWLIEKNGILFYKGIQLAGKNALVMTAARKSLRNIAAQSVKTVISHSLAPVSKNLKMEQVIILAKEMVKIFDPGFSVICFMSKKSLQAMMSLSRQMDNNLPHIKIFLEKIINSPKWLQQESHADYDFIATYRAMNGKIGIKVLPNLKYHGRKVFTVVNPDSGIIFGPKFFLTKNHKLKVIPLKFGMRIKNIVEQGLSGRGAQRAAAQWTPANSLRLDHAESSSVNHAMLVRRQAQGNFNEYGLSVMRSKIIGDIDGHSHSMIYDISYNIFYFRYGNSKVEPVINKPLSEKFFICTSKRLEKWYLPFIAQATLNEQMAGIKILGIDLKWSFSPLKIPANRKREIPKKITSIWVGNNDIPDSIILNLQNNALQAKTSTPPFNFKLYISSDDKIVYQRNLNKISKLAKDVVIINLECTHYFEDFKRTKYYNQYMAAIDGNNGIATSFASACDILRLDLVNRRGGLYLDVDDIITKTFSDTTLKTTPDGLVLFTPVYHAGLSIHGKYPNSNWATHIGNPTLKMMLEEGFRRYQNHKELYQYRPSDKDEAIFTQYAATLSYVSGPDLFNYVIGKYLPVEKQTREALKLLNLPVVMDHTTYNRLTEFVDLDVCALKKLIDLGNANTWRYSR